MTLRLDEQLLDEAHRLGGEPTYSKTVDRALNDFVRRIRARKILQLGGSGAWKGSLDGMRRNPPPRPARS
jgi:hypothetical protein